MVMKIITIGKKSEEMFGKYVFSNLRSANEPYGSSSASWKQPKFRDICKKVKVDHYRLSAGISATLDSAQNENDKTRLQKKVSRIRLRLEL